MTLTRQVNYRPIACERCGDVFAPRNPRHAWCDACLTKACQQCGSSFHIGKRTLFDTARFCSRACKGAWRTAHYVGAAAPNYRTGRRMRGIRSDTSSAYRAWRSVVVGRAGGRCQECGSERPTRRLHAHHLQPVRIRPDLSLDEANGVALCAPCHRKREWADNLKPGMAA